MPGSVARRDAAQCSRNTIAAEMSAKIVPAVWTNVRE
jgi:hypothetical protein